MYHKKIFSLVLVCTLAIGLSLTGCSKDEILDQYNNVVQLAGNATLTRDLSLKGKRMVSDE